jgi:hypothetical protein
MSLRQQPGLRWSYNLFNNGIPYAVDNQLTQVRCDVEPNATVYRIDGLNGSSSTTWLILVLYADGSGRMEYWSNFTGQTVCANSYKGLWRNE